MATWSIEEAQENFDDLLDKAISDGEQYLTRDGHVIAVVMIKEHWDSLGKGETSLDVGSEAARSKSTCIADT